MGNCMANETSVKPDNVKAAWLAYSGKRGKDDLQLPQIMDEDELDYLISSLRKQPLKDRPKNLQLVVGPTVLLAKDTEEFISTSFRRSKVFQLEEEEKEDIVASSNKLHEFFKLLSNRLESLELIGHIPAHNFYHILDAVASNSKNLQAIRFVEMDLRGHATGQQLQECLTSPAMGTVHSIHLQYSAIDEAMLNPFADGLVQLRELYSFDIVKCGMTQGMYNLLARRLEDHKDSSPFARSMELDLHANCARPSKMLKNL
mmetsp:Transcript_8062/g.18028  ORF Transcript_8062/g.18028 Transcript_8062/m.18028 type:complete len:259 (-) Transcript_8062:80-856(-)